MLALDVVRRSLPRLPVFDVALTAVLAVGGIVEAALEGDAADHRIPALTLLVTLPLLVRRRWPLAVMLAVFLGAVVSWEAPYVEITCAAIAAYSVGAHEERWLLGLAELLAIGAAVVATLGGQLPPLPDFVGPFFVVLPVWLAGSALRQARDRAAALAERARRLEQEQHLVAKVARAEERARLARELHDVAAHSVSVMVVQAGAARQVVERTPDRAVAALGAVEETGRQAMQEMRRILGVLGDGETDPGPQPGLAQVGALVEAVRDAGLPVRLETRGPDEGLPVPADLAAYRVVQEALTNAVKHSGLAPTTVLVDRRPRELKLEVLCDGPPPAAAGPPGRGLAGMRERVALVGGRLEAGPGVDGGYQVRAWLPVEADA